MKNKFVFCSVEVSKCMNATLFDLLNGYLSNQADNVKIEKDCQIHFLQYMICCHLHSSVLLAKFQGSFGSQHE